MKKTRKKNKYRGGLTWGYRISRGIKEILCGISTQRQPRKGYVEFPGSWFLVLEFPRDLMQQGWRYLSEISRGKVNKRKILFQKSMSLTLLFVLFLELPVVFEVLKVLLKIICKMLLPDLLFFVLC